MGGVAEALPPSRTVPAVTHLMGEQLDEPLLLLLPVSLAARCCSNPPSPSQPKGADRKQKTDREKMEKRTPHEKEKYQPSYETTILTEVGARAGGGRKRGEPSAGAEELAWSPWVARDR